MHHTEEHEAVDVQQEQFHEAVQSGHWLSLIVSIDSIAEEMTLRTTTWQFPRAEFVKALKMIADKLQELHDNQPEPLPLADFVSQIKADAERRIAVHREEDVESND